MKNRIVPSILCAAGILGAPAVSAQQAPAPQAAAPAARAPGAATREWLELQRSGRAAGKSHPVPGEIADLTWRRYVDSYKHPIPERLGSPVPEAGGRR